MQQLLSNIGQGFLILLGVAVLIVIVLFIVAAVIGLVQAVKQGVTAQAPIVYRMKEGETLPDVCARYDLKWQEVLQLNRLDSIHDVKPGMAIMLKEARYGSQ